MIKPHEICPICNHIMIHSKCLNKSCPLIEKDKFSYVESICNHPADENKGIPVHMFFQITSLYNELLLEKVYFPKDNFEISVNYVLTSTVLVYFNSANNNFFNYNNLGGDKIVLNNRLMPLDYPDLTKAINKIKTLALFI